MRVPGLFMTGNWWAQPYKSLGKIMTAAVSSRVQSMVMSSLEGSIPENYTPSSAPYILSKTFYESWGRGGRWLASMYHCVWESNSWIFSGLFTSYESLQLMLPTAKGVALTAVGWGTNLVRWTWLFRGNLMKHHGSFRFFFLSPGCSCPSSRLPESSLWPLSSFCILRSGHCHNIFGFWPKSFFPQQ